MTLIENFIIDSDWTLPKCQYDLIIMHNIYVQS